MKISIKQAGIIVAIFAIIALALVGCFCAISVKDNTINSVLKKDDVMTTADKEYLLQGECDEMAEIWNAAMTESIQHNRHIKLTLMNDWIAKDGGSQVTMFGEGVGFTFGRFEVANGAEITLDLNGFTIDRNLTNKNLADDKKPTSAMIKVLGTFNLMDSKYDIAEVNKVYEQYKNQAANATDRELLENLSKIECGKITGSNCASTGAAGIHVYGIFNMYSGMIIENKSITGAGGGIQAGANSVFNMYNGAVIGNYAPNGGGIYVTQANVCNIQGGLIAENEARASGGAIFIMSDSDKRATISNCIVSHNSATGGSGGGLYTGSNINGAKSLGINIDNVEFIANYAKNMGAAIRCDQTVLLTIAKTKCEKNIVDDGGTVAILNVQKSQFKNVEITDNVCKYAKQSGCGGGTAGLTIINTYALNLLTHTEMSDVLIKNNKITDCNPKGDLLAGAGMFLNARQPANIDMKNVRITDNTVNTSSQYAAGGIIAMNAPYYRIIENVVIDGNRNEQNASNVVLYKNQPFTIIGALDGNNAVTRIGVTFNSGYPAGTPFTIGYSDYNNGKDPNKYFYSDNTDKLMTTENGEVKLGDDTKPSQTTVTWRYKANGGSDTATHDIKGSAITLPYNPSGYTITNSVNNIIKAGSSTGAPQEVVDNVGNYAFTATAQDFQNYLNPTLTVAIEPKKVDIVWSNTELTYNGNTQLPTAKIAEDESCTITITGGQMNVGKGYVATATGIKNNANYVINPATSSTMFSIKPADLTINLTTKSFEREYNGKVVSLPKDWYTLSATFLGRDKNLLLDLVFDIDYNAFIPQFNGADNAVAVGDYTISTKPFTASEVFKNNLNYNVSINYVNTGNLTITVPSVVRPTDNSGYDFVFNENGRRVNYKDKDLIHGDNDSAITTFVLGNITPNTSVQTFVNNLSFDTTKITIYNKAGEVVFGTGALSYYTDNINNSLEVAIGTGWRIEYTKLIGGEETIYLSVLGDLTGDGKVNATDVNYIRKLINDPTMYADLNDKPYIQLAAMIINNGKLTNADGEILWNIVCGKMSIEDFI